MLPKSNTSLGNIFHYNGDMESIISFYSLGILEGVVLINNPHYSYQSLCEMEILQEIHPPRMKLMEYTL